VIVADASVIATALADDGADGDRARNRLREDSDLHAPHLVDLEVMSVIRKEAHADALNDRRAQLALDDLSRLPIVRYPHIPFADRIWALRHNVTVYDAGYIALAEALECVFLTSDRALALVDRAECEVELLLGPAG
jgi:predicted nucleic acid-binding protein